jgi:hypothetical protein
MTASAPPLWIMISGPYGTGARSEADRAENLKALNRAGYEVFRRGHVPVIGVNAALPMVQTIGEQVYEDLMLPLSLALAERCDAVLRVGGPSEGADREVERFLARGLPVYRTVDDLPPVTAPRRR